MDPLSVITGVGGIVICCKNITCSLAMFVNDVRNHDVTVESFRTEVSSLEVLLLTIDDRLKAYPANTGDANAPLWSSIKGSLDDCEVTLKRLDSELDRIKQKKVRSQNMWQKPYSVLRLNMSADTIKTIRSQIHTHVGALQMSLSCISVCLLLDLPGKTASGTLQDVTTVNELTLQIEGLQQNIREVERLLRADRSGQEAAMLSHIETVKIAATDLVTSATSVATLSSNEHSDATVKEHNHTAFEPHHITSEDRIGTWLTKSSEHQESESASCTSTESTRRDSIFSDEETALMSPTSEAESFMPLPLRTSKTIAPSTGSRDRGSITSEHSSIRAKQFQDDRDFNVVLSAMGKWEKSAQAKILKGDLAGAQQDLRSALDCRDLLMSDFANNRELVVLQKLVEIGGRHLERLQYDESEHLFKFAIDRAGHMSNEISDSLKRDIVGKACAIALTKLESDDLFLFDKFSEIARLYRSNILDANLRMKTLDDFALQAATKACEVVAQKLEVDDHDLEACDQLSRIALQQAHHLYRSSTNGLEATLQNFQLPQIANEVVEENIDQRRFGKAESLAEQLIQYARRLPSERIYEADLGRTHFNLAYSCYAQKTDEKLDKAERTLYTSEEWQGNDAHLVHATSYLLAQIYWKKGNLEGAENCCWTALKGRVELYGEDHESYLEVVDLFVRILKARGANDEASLHAIQLTPEYRRKSATQWCAMHACYESKEEVLKRATVGGYEEAIKILIQEGVACSDLLRQAASTGDLEAAQLLLAAGVLRFGEFDHSARKPASDHPIALADQNGHSAILRLLLQNAQMIEDCAATYGLHWAVREQRVTAVAALLDLGVRPDNLVDGTSLLHVVAENAWLSILNELLRVRPDLQIADAKGSTPLHIAVLGGHQSIVEALLEAGADIEYKKGPSTPLQLAIDKRKVSVVRRLLDRGASPLVKADIGNHSAVNALHQAVISNDKPMVEELLNHHPNLIGTKTSEDRTGLHLALMECGYQMARLLIERGIDVNVRTSMGNTAYDLACRRASRDRDFEKLLASKMSPKPSKFKFGLNGYYSGASSERGAASANNIAGYGPRLTQFSILSDVVERDR